MASIRDTLTKLLASDKPEPGTPLANYVGQYPFQQGEAPLEAPMLSPDDLIGTGIGKAALTPLIAGMVKNPSVEKALIGKTANELRHADAQKYATEMLGLHPNNTSMDRAKALNYIDNKWHETNAENYNKIINEGFNPNKALAAATDEQTPYGVFVKSNPQSIGIGKQSEVQMPLMTRPSNNITFANRYELQNYLNQYPQLKTATENVKNADKLAASEIEKIGDEMFSYGRGDHPKKAELWDKINYITSDQGPVAQLSKKSKELITKHLTNKDVNAINLLNDEGSFGRNVNTQIILDPRNIRSRFAAFDPRYTGAAAIAAGTASADLLADEDKQKLIKALKQQ